MQISRLICKEHAVRCKQIQNPCVDKVNNLIRKAPNIHQLCDLLRESSQLKRKLTPRAKTVTHSNRNSTKIIYRKRIF